MFARIALRSIARTPFASVLIILMLGTAAASFGLTLSFFSPFIFSEEVPGAPCADSLVRVLFRAKPATSGELLGFVSPEQYKALRELDSAEIYGQAKVGGLPILIDGTPVAGSVAFGDPSVLDALCVERSRFAGPAPAPAPGPPGAIIAARLNQSTDPEAITIKGVRMPVISSVFGYNGLTGESNIVAWLPYDEAYRLGIPLADARTTLIAKVRDGYTAAELEEELDTKIEQRPELFSRMSGAITLPSLTVNSAQVQRVRKLIDVSIIAGGAYLVLAIVSILLLERARRAERESVGGLLVALGATRLQILSAASCEPLLLGVAALPVAVLVSTLLVNLSLTIVSDPTVRHHISAIVSFASCFAALGLYVIASSFYRARGPARYLLVKQSNRRQGRARPYLLGLQAFAAAGSLAVSASALLNLAKSTPRDHGFDVENVLVYMIEGGWLSDHPGFRIEPTAGLAVFRGNPALTVGASLSWMPFAGYEAIQSNRATFGEKSVDVVLTQVSGDYFGALNMNRVQGSYFKNEPPWDLKEDRPRVAVINAKLAEQLYGTTTPGPVTLELAAHMFKKGETVTLNVVGVVDEGATGNESGLSSDRLQPAVYIPQGSGLWGVYHQIVWVRHAPTFPPTVIDDLVERAAPMLLPGGRVGYAATGKEALESVLSKERGLAWITGLAALGSLAIALIAMNSLLNVQLLQQSGELLVQYAFGRSRVFLVRQLFLQTLIPCLVGSGAVALVLYVIATLVERTLGVSSDAWTWGILVGPMLVLALASGSVVHQSRRIFALEFMQALRVA